VWCVRGCCLGPCRAYRFVCDAWGVVWAQRGWKEEDVVTVFLQACRESTLDTLFTLEALCVFIGKIAAPLLTGRSLVE
jgi:hypothetical protein